VFLPRERGFVGGAGAGLGLAIARGIVDAHGGAIRIEPTGRGTTLAVTIPVDRPEPDAPRDAFDSAIGDVIDGPVPRVTE
jgi:two-component system, OmpR family, sensor histidine kinase KdpD